MAGQMKSNPFAGTRHVYQFTLRELICSKGWLISTLLFSALMVLGIPIALWAFSNAKNPDKAKDKDAEIKKVLVADETEGEADYAALQTVGYTDVSYQAFDSMEDAIAGVSDPDSTVILRVTKPDELFSLTVYLPEDSELSRSTASSFGSFAAENFSVILMQKARLTAQATVLLSLPVKTETSLLKADATAEDTGKTEVQEILNAMIPFMMMMCIYMMVILYGQSMANSVMLEKTSKLMETILTAVQPPAMMAGKLLATATAAVVQLMVWGVAGFIGMLGGAFFALQMVPNADPETVAAINDISGTAVSISAGGVLLSFVIFALGFLLYLSLSGISGALASKTEDLNKTNAIFVLFLLGSFLLCFGSADDAERTHSLMSQAEWLNYFPFTSILVVPARLVLSQIPLWKGLVSILILIATIFGTTFLAGKIYQLLVLYRGAPPKPKALVEMLRSGKAGNSGSSGSGAA